MLSESGLKQKPSKSKQDRQTLPAMGEGRVRELCVCVRVSVRRQASVFAK